MKYLVAGLGNIGPDYAGTRHNIGFMVADRMVALANTTFDSKRYAFTATVKHRGRIFVIIKPTTFMNLSGKAISYWLQKEGIPDENLMVITDDIALPMGTLRLRKKGGDGGHNGLANIIEHLGTQDFARLRIGIGNDFPSGKQVNYVLGGFSNEDLKLIEPKLDIAVDIIKSFGTIGIDSTMNNFNKRG